MQKRVCTKITKEVIEKDRELYLYAAISMDNVPPEKEEEIRIKFEEFWEKVQEIIK